MNEITLANYRCFRDPQVARLAPLTLLVGDNSTGKTSFLALTRALWDIAFRERVPDFKEAPYDLGSFDEIIHRSQKPAAAQSAFTASFRLNRLQDMPNAPEAELRDGPLQFTVTFEKSGSAPLPTVRRVEAAEHWIEDGLNRANDPSFRFGNASGEWTWTTELHDIASLWKGHFDLSPFFLLIEMSREFESDPEHIESLHDTSPADEHWDTFKQLCQTLRGQADPPFASAPVRSQPRRTYDPARLTGDSEGQYIPMYLADLLRNHKKTWKSMKSALEDFGRRAGLFHQINVKQLGTGDGDPFQMQLRQAAEGRSRGPARNLVDVGYGVSQVLPIATELLRPDGAQLFLVQQPEVHLHPSAQAALGGLFCDVAARGRQLLVETHSDHFIDRIRMKVRDGKTKLKPQEVSILYFEHGNQSVTIHSLGWDEQGRLVGRSGPIPDGYREFFRTERRRSLGL